MKIAYTPVHNFLTFDIEECYHANYEGLDFSPYSSQKTNLEELVDQLIFLCEKHAVKSTCFIVGSVAKKKPQIVKKLAAAGHEIASHSFRHNQVFRMTPKQFHKDLKHSCDVLEDITGKKVLGFRAPSWSVNEEMLGWYYQVLAEQGLRYSSSVFPAKTFLYGIAHAPMQPYKVKVEGSKKIIHEFPCSVMEIGGKRLGFSGGAYFRLLPFWLIKKLIEKQNHDAQQVIMYLHPREIDPHQVRLPLPWKEAWIHYYGISGCEQKLEKLLRDFHPTLQKRICDVLTSRS